MAGILVAQEVLRVGSETLVEGLSPSRPYCCVFEDDGRSAYFYALDLDRTEQRVVDAMHIYNVTSVANRDRPSTLQVVWSEDGMKAALLINDYAHAVFDFEHRRGYCRTGSPPASEWATNDHSWSESALIPFRAVWLN